MDTRDSDRSGNDQPLMAPLEELEKRAYPSQGETEPTGSTRDNDGLLPDIALPTATGQPLPAPAPEEFGDGTDRRRR